MPKKTHPRRGSLAHAPRKRTAKQTPRIRSWPKQSEVGLKGFAGYKAGMTHVFMIDDHPGRPTRDQEINVPVTVVEVPPIKVCAIRVYGDELKGERTLTEVWSTNPSGDLSRTVKMSDNYDQEAAYEKAEDYIEEENVSEINVIVHTQPRLSSVRKKKPEVLELEIGGDSMEDKWDYGREVLGSEFSFADVFEEGKYADIFAISKGKGFQGPVKRWGVKIQPHKVQQARRHTGVLGPWRPSRIMRSVPMSGQTGYHQRMEYNKRILKIGEDGDEVTPEGGFLRFGEINNSYILLKGSVPGPTNRMIFLRKPMKQKSRLPSNVPTITYIDTSSQQGG